MELFLTFILSMMVTVVLIPPLMKSAARLKILDVPNERKIHTGSIPRVGGLAMVVGAVLPILVLMSGKTDVTYLSTALLVLLVFGVLDDRFELNYKVKFLGQFFAVWLVVIVGDVTIHKMPLFEYAYLPDYVAIPFTIFALLGVTNAVNLSDGLDGLAAGLSMLSLGVIAIIAFRADNLVVLMLALTVMGSILGFLRFNTFPARIFMGDTGSQFLGFTLGIAVILLTQQKDVPLSPSIVLLLLGLPIIDTVSVMLLRLSKGQSPFRPDKNHIHHRLLGIGFKHHEVVLIFYIIQSVMVISAYFLRFDADVFVLALYALYCVMILATLTLAEHYGIRVHNQLKVNELSWIEHNVRWLQDKNRILRSLLLIAALLIAGLFMVAAAFVSEIPGDIHVLTISMIVIFGGLFLFRSPMIISWAERIVIYTLGALVIYILQYHSVLTENVLHYLDVSFVLMTAAVILGFRFSPDKDFVANPMDYLVMFIAIAAAILPEFQLVDRELGLNIVRLIVIFYAMEFVLNHVHRCIDFVRYLALFTLAIISLRGIY